MAREDPPAARPSGPRPEPPLGPPSRAYTPTIQPTPPGIPREVRTFDCINRTSLFSNKRKARSRLGPRGLILPRPRWRRHLLGANIGPTMASGPCARYGRDGRYGREERLDQIGRISEGTAIPHGQPGHDAFGYRLDRTQVVFESQEPLHVSLKAWIRRSNPCHDIRSAGRVHAMQDDVTIAARTQSLWEDVR